jgi:hypothetical protein
MAKTYMILRGNKANDSEVLEYERTLKGAKDALSFFQKKGYKKVFILMLQGSYFGEGFHKYTLELVGGKFKKNTKL